MKQMNEHLSYLIEVNGKKMIAKKVANKKSMHTYMDNDKKLQLLLAKKENNGTPDPHNFTRQIDLDPRARGESPRPKDREI
jgi:hypothetical protein